MQLYSFFKFQSIFLIWISLLLINPIDSFQSKLKESRSYKSFSFNFDYRGWSSELSWNDAKYDTEKSSQRENITNVRHCHPYALFYDSFFKNKKDDHLIIAELGIDSSLLMWRDYFGKATLYGFDSNVDVLNSFRERYDDDRIHLAQVNVCDASSIASRFEAMGIQYDLIIDDATHQFEDQLRIIQNVHPYLKPGGMLIVENIFKKYDEESYFNRLKPILHVFQDFYFVSMDPKNRNSTGWDNDKLLVLVKAGAEPLFKSKKKITIITPSIRPWNLLRIKDSIDFNYVDEWIIVYDASKIERNLHLFAREGNKKIKEYIHTSKGGSGNPQRNYALDRVQNEDTYLYFLDDDNVIHKDLYRLLDIIDDGKIYTFDQENRLKGTEILLGQIDTAMFLIDFKLCKNIRWKLNEYAADFYYINECYSKNKDKWIYVNNALSNYNVLPRKFTDNFLTRNSF